MNKSSIEIYHSPEGNVELSVKLENESTYAKIAYIPETRERVYETALYNLDIIISVGYRVKAVNGTRFRQWANKVQNTNN